MEVTEGTAVAPIEHALEDGWTLPADWYSDPGVLALERDRIFATAWQYAGPLEWVADGGCFFAAQVGHVPVAVVARRRRPASRIRQRLPPSRPHRPVR